MLRDFLGGKIGWNGESGPGGEDGVLGDVSVLRNASGRSTDLSVDVSVEGLEACFVGNAAAG